VNGEGNLNILRYNYVKLHGKHTTKEQENTRCLRDLLFRNAYNLEGIFPPFKKLSDGEAGGQRCIHHGLKQNFFVRYATLTN